MKIGWKVKFLYFGFCSVSSPWKLNPLNGVITASVVQPIVATSFTIGRMTVSLWSLGLVNWSRNLYFV